MIEIKEITHSNRYDDDSNIDKQLKEYAVEIVEYEKDILILKNKVRGIYSNAKFAGYNSKMLRKAIKDVLKPPKETPEDREDYMNYKTQLQFIF
jgi:uncharacterized protein (UPF0335 family)